MEFLKLKAMYSDNIMLREMNFLHKSLRLLIWKCYGWLHKTGCHHIIVTYFLFAIKTHHPVFLSRGTSLFQFAKRMGCDCSFFNTKRLYILIFSLTINYNLIYFFNYLHLSSICIHGLNTWSHIKVQKTKSSSLFSIIQSIV